MGFGQIALTLYLNFEGLNYFNVKDYQVVIAGFIIEFALYFLIAAVSFALLALKWEGYYQHRCLQFFHYLFLVLFSSLIPHGEFLLHFGYRQRGYNTKKGVEEPFPDGFELPKERLDYQGYLTNSTRGGFFVFFLLGFTRCALILIRMALIFTCYLDQPYNILNSGTHFGLPVMAFFGTYTLINLLMVCRVIMESFNWKRLLCSCGCRAMFDSCCFKKRRVASEASALLGDDSLDESEGEIL